MQLNNDEIRRYSRHLILPEVGLAGQKKIRSTSVLCIGAGGLGSPIAMYLAAAGIGKLGIVDFDVVDYSNLQRQILHTASRCRPAQVAVGKGNHPGRQPECRGGDSPHAHYERKRIRADRSPMTSSWTGRTISRRATLTNDACVLLRKPNIYGSIFRFEGQASVFAPHLGGPCYRCLYPEPPPPGMVPSCAEGGVLGVSARHHRLHPGNRDFEAGSRQGQFPHWPPACC
jgi:hypothetical protein